MAECNRLLNEVEKAEGKYLSIFFFSSFSPFTHLQFQNIFSALVTGQKEETRSEKALVSRTCNTHVRHEKVVNADMGPRYIHAGSEGTYLST